MTLRISIKNSLSDVNRNIFNHVNGKARDLFQHPGSGKQKSEEDRQYFGNKGQRHFLDLGNSLENTDHEPHGKPEAQHGQRQINSEEDGLFSEFDHKFRSHGYTPKLFRSDPQIKCQPSTRTKSISLKGKDIMTGGSIIIPMARSTEATTISMTRKGI